MYRVYVAGEVPGTAPLVDTLATADHANCAIEGVGENLKHALPFPGMVVHAFFRRPTWPGMLFNQWPVMSSYCALPLSRQPSNKAVRMGDNCILVAHTAFSHLLRSSDHSIKWCLPISSTPILSTPISSTPISS